MNNANINNVISFKESMRKKIKNYPIAENQFEMTSSFGNYNLPYR